MYFFKFLFFSADHSSTVILFKISIFSSVKPKVKSVISGDGSAAVPKLGDGL